MTTLTILVVLLNLIVSQARSRLVHDTKPGGAEAGKTFFFPEKRHGSAIGGRSDKNGIYKVSSTVRRNKIIREQDSEGDGPAQISKQQASPLHKTEDGVAGTRISK